MYHNEIITNIIKYAKANELKPNILYFFVVGHDPDWIWCIEDEEMVMEEFSTFLNVDGMEKHISSLLQNTSMPFNSVRYIADYSNSNKIIIPFSFQDIHSIETSCVECFFAFEVM